MDVTVTLTKEDAEYLALVLDLGGTAWDDEAQRIRTVILGALEHDCSLKADLDEAIEVAEGWLVDAPNYTVDERIIPEAALLRLVQRLNAASEHAHTTSSTGRSS